MAPHQQRVIDEQAELNARLEKLTAFTFTETFEKLPDEEKGRLNRQHGIMGQYSEVLGERIAAFQ